VHATRRRAQRDVVAFSVNDRALGLVALIGEAAKGTHYICN
jgi:hypothetical protein